VIDTLTIRSGRRGAQAGDQSEESTDTQATACNPTSATAEQARIETQEPALQKMIYRSISQIPLKSRTQNPFNKTDGGWEAAKAVMG